MLFKGGASEDIADLQIMHLVYECLLFNDAKALENLTEARDQGKQRFNFTRNPDPLTKGNLPLAYSRQDEQLVFHLYDLYVRSQMSNRSQM